MAKFTIEVVSDTLCPWSYVGKKNLDVAMSTWLQSHPDADFDIIWRPYYLTPKARVSAYEKRQFYALKFGPFGWAKTQELLARAAEPLSVQFCWDGLVGNSRDSHKLIAFAGGGRITPESLTAAAAAAQQQRDDAGEKAKPDGDDDTAMADDDDEDKERQPAPAVAVLPHAADHGPRGLATRLIDALFKGAFEDGGDISDRDFLVRVAVSLGMREQDVRACFDDPDFSRAVDDDARDAMTAREVAGVPMFVINDRYILGGCVQPHLFVEAFQRHEDAVTPGAA